jgi:hypothetical protein
VSLVCVCGGGGCVNGNGAVSEQRDFVYHVEESMAGPVGVMEFIKS